MEFIKSRTGQVAIIGVLAVLLLLTGGAGARSSQSNQSLAPAATVNASISFQGRLVDNSGVPLNGTYDLGFTFWSASNAGSQIGSATWRNGQLISDGLYNTAVNVDPDLVHGQELWLRIQVRETGSAIWEYLTPRVQVLPTAYAMTLRPGARIQGEPTTSDGAVLRSTLDGFYPSGSAMWGTSPATGVGVRGESGGGFGVYGYSGGSYGVWGNSGDGWGGYFSSSTGHGIVAKSDGTTVNDHGGVFSANWGWGVFSESTHNQALRGEAGDLSSGKSMPGGAWGTVGIGQSGGVWGSSWNNWGAYGDSRNYRGVVGNTDRADRNYGLHTYDNLYSLNYNLAGAIMNVAQNGGSEALELGDVVVFSGISAPNDRVGAPLIQVAKADAANSTAVAGVVFKRVNIEAFEDNGGPAGVEVSPEGTREIGSEDRAGDEPAFQEVTSDRPVEPGEYLLVVVQGPAQVKASTFSGAIEPGTLLSSGSQAGYAGRAAEAEIAGVTTTVPGTVFGKALESAKLSQELIYVFVTLQ